MTSSLEIKKNLFWSSIR